MIVLQSNNGSQVKSFMAFESGKLGYHQLFGFTTEDSLNEKLRFRRLRGKSNARSKWNFSFNVQKNSKVINLEKFSNCSGVQVSESEWLLNTPQGEFRLIDGQGAQALDSVLDHEERYHEEDSFKKIVGTVFTVMIGFFIFLNTFEKAEEPKEDEMDIEVVTVEKKTVKIRPITVSTAPKAKTKKVKKTHRAIKQNLGFLGLLGNKKMKKALGGIKTNTKNSSAGVGQGQQGSGGELLVGLGKGVKKTTVGNTGVAGLGGIGTKGAGGGQGGYGNVSVASGEGEGISSIAVSKDMVLSGGLEYNAVAATIAKYINQVRDCYERGLLKNPKIKGTVTTRFQINKNGLLNYSKVKNTSLKNQGVESCITARMKTWKFPKPRGGVAVNVNYPFLLKPSKI